MVFPSCYLSELTMFTGGVTALVMYLCLFAAFANVLFVLHRVEIWKKTIICRKLDPSLNSICRSSHVSHRVKINFISLKGTRPFCTKHFSVCNLQFQPKYAKFGLWKTLEKPFPLQSLEIFLYFFTYSLHQWLWDK